MNKQTKSFRNLTSLAAVLFISLTITTAQVHPISSQLEKISYGNSQKSGDFLSNEKTSRQLTSITTTDTINQQDSLALVALYNATNGANWTNNTNWLTGQVKDWYGITTHGGRVTDINLNNNNLNGLLPADLWQLTELLSLQLGTNQNLNGSSLPPELGDLTKLEHLDLRRCNLTGTIPTEIGLLTNLTHLYLYQNKLSGTVPIEIGQLINLENLSLSSNQLTGTVPMEISNLTKIRDVYLYRNLFDSLPDLNMPANLELFKCGNNKFTFEDLEYNMDLKQTVANFSYSPQKTFGDPDTVNLNRYDSYTLNTTCGGTQNSYQWFLNGDSISPVSATTPFTIDSIDYATTGAYTCKVTNTLVSGLTLQSAPIYLKLAEPPCNQQDSLALVAFYNATDGANWTNNANWLTGQVKNWYGITTLGGRVTDIDLNNNHLNGSLPADIGQLTELLSLQLNWNGSLYGSSLPPELGNLTKLKYLKLKYCFLFGTIPVEIGQLINLELLDLSRNRFSGSIPIEIGLMTKLTQLDFTGNNLTGNIPIEIGQLINLENLDLSLNQLTGTVPMGISNLTKIHSLHLENNQFDSLPDLNAPANLDMLFIRNNKLTFEDLEYNMDLNQTVSSFVYSPQKTFGTPDTVALDLYDSYTFNTICGGTQNNYQWFFNGDSISPVSTSATFTIDSIDFTMTGPYTCNVTNTLVTGLTLQSAPIYIELPPCNQQDSLALVALYNATDGANWTNNTNWLTGQVKDWYGITTHCGRVTDIHLDYNHLKGSLPADIGQLTELLSLQLNWNGSLYGSSLPPELGNLTKLKYLKLKSCFLFGTIPSEIGQLVNLEYLDLSHNQLTGAIPLEINNLTKISSLYLDANRFNSLPDLNAPVSLNKLFIKNNKLTFEDLEYNMDLNQTVTSFVYSPQETFGTPDTVVLNLYDSYTLNTTCGGTQNHYQWFLNGDSISPGSTTAPFTIDSINYTMTGAYTCKVTNTLVTELTLLSAPIYLKLVEPSCNQQDSLALVALYNATDGANWKNNTNWLTGQVKNWYGITTLGGRVSEINLYENNLNGLLPADLWQLTELLSLRLGSNQKLNGSSLPPELGQLTKLEYLDLRYCNFTGTIPTEIGLLTNLTHLHFYHNNLSGTIPVEIGQLINLDFLDLSYNQLTGTVSLGISNLTKIYSLYLNNNQFDSLPDLNAPANLDILFIGNNKLTFEDLEYNMDLNQTVSSFVYSPQETFGTPDTIYLSTGDVLELNAICGGSDNHYQWYKNSVAITGWNTTGLYQDFTVTTQDTGSYYCRVQNPLVPNLTLQSHSIQVYLQTKINVPVNVQQGWNIFSVNNTPDSTDIKTLFQPFIDNSSLVKIQDEQGHSLEDYGLFGGWQNNIGDISPTEGYKIKVSIDDSLEICGAPVKYPYPIFLQNGWNIMGYPQTGEFNGMDIIQQLINKGELIKVQDEQGRSIEDYGVFGGWQNNIGNFTPGEGYKVKVNTNDTLWIKAGYSKSSAIQYQIIATTHFFPAFEGNGVDHMNFNIVKLPVNLLQPGDELAIFDGETCVGATTLLPEHIHKQTVSIITSSTDNYGMKGFVEGNPFTLKLWNTIRNEEFLLVPDIAKGPLWFTKHETTFASLAKYAVTGIDGLIEQEAPKVKCYPNPFSDEIKIEINLPKDSQVEIAIFNQVGQKIKYLTTEKMLTRGTHKFIWNGRNNSNGEIAPGIYYLRMNIDENISHKKIVYSK